MFQFQPPAAACDSPCTRRRALASVARWVATPVLAAPMLAGPMLAAPLLATATSRWSPAAAGERWFDERELGPVHVHADFSLAPHTALLTEVTRLQADLRASLELPPVRDPIHMFLFERKPVYLAYLREYFPRVPYRRALFIKERGPGMVLAFRSPEFEVDLRHESTHALLHAVLADLPLWLDEGLAEYFEMPADQRAGGNPYLAQVRWLSWAGQAPALEPLETVADIADMGRGEYRNAWAWVHFMLHGPPDAKAELLRYLADARDGLPADPLSVRLRSAIPERDKRLATHFKQFKG
jgi:hypothetical protein